MTKRLMTDRELLEALVFAVEALSADAEVPTTETVQRLVRTAARAKQDLFPQD